MAHFPLRRFWTLLNHSEVLIHDAMEKPVIIFTNALWFESVQKWRSGKWATRSLARSLRSARPLAHSLHNAPLRSAALRCVPLAHSFAHSDLADDNASILDRFEP